MDYLKGNSGFSSSCIFFEASGDSEGDFDPNMGVGGYADDEIARCGGYDLSHGHVDDDDDDDAMSCSYDRSEYYSCNVVAAEANANWGESNCDVAHDIDDDDHKEHDDVMKKDGVYGASYCEEDDDDDEILQQQHNHKPFVSFDSNQEFVDEMEKNRLFWEACLAS